MFNVDTFKNDIRNKDINNVYKKYFFGSYIWYFDKKYNEKSYEQYDKLRYYISDKLSVHFNNIAIVGSAKTGFSLNPQKNFNIFSDSSDIDIVIVSSKLFHSFWDEYIKENNSNTGIRREKSYVFKCIFKKFIIFNGFDSSNTYYAEWLKKTKGFEKELQITFEIDNKINYRIFESWQAVEYYYTKGLLDNKKKIIGE